MTPFVLTQSQQSAPCLPGTWKLEPGRAITLRPREDGVLRIAHGRLWATFDGPHAGPANDLGDRVVGAGGQLRVAAGRRLVLEPADTGEAAWFSWEVAPATASVPAARSELVLQPLHDLRAATALAGSALVRLAGGLARLALASVLPRPAASRHRAPAC